jgi:hypothetical protein
MKTSAAIFICLVLGLQVLQAFVGILDGAKLTKEADPWLFWINEYRMVTIPSLAFLVALFPFASQWIIVPKKVKHETRGAILKIMLGNIFENRKGIRITIFKDVWWIRVAGLWLKKNLRHPVIWYRGKSKYTFPKWGKYIQVSERVGSEYLKSKTYFYYSENTAKECEGIAAVVRQSNGEETAVDLPDINNIDLAKISLLETSTDANRVKKYMKKGFINELETLKRIHVKARHFYATILVDKRAKSVAVLVIDSDTQASPFNDVVMSKINGYVELFSSAF